MIHLQLFGSVDLRSDDGSQVVAVLRQPKRMALLIYLALNPPVYHRRDRLLAMFWPDLDEERARRALSQAVFQIRAALGKEVLANRGDEEIGLRTGTLRCDVAEFENALEEDRLSDAVELYAGEVAPSFVLSEANDFQDWLDERRTRAKVRAHSACMQLAESSEEPQVATKWLRRAIEIDRFSEPAYQRLILALDAAGDRAAALQVYDDLKDLLQREFDAEPSAETNEVVRTVRERAAPQHGFRLPISPRASVQSIRKSRRLMVATISGALVVIAVIWSALTERQPKKYHPPMNRIAVLYFNDQSATHDLQYLAEGLTSTLIDQLGQVGRLEIISQNGVRPFRGDSVPLDSIAQKLDVGVLVGGSVAQSGDRLRVTVEMIDGASGLVLKSRTVERPRAELFALLDDITNEVATFLRTTVGQEVRLQAWRAETKSVEAWRAVQQSEQLVAEASDLDKKGSITEEWATLARADTLAMNALQMDKRFVSALVLRGNIAAKRAWLSLLVEQPPNPAKHFDVAERFAQQAIVYDGKNAEAHQLNGAVDYWRWLLSNGADSSRIASAEAHLRESIRLAGELPRGESVLSMVLQSKGDFRGARIAAKRALQADAYLSDADQIVNRLFEASFQVGDDVEAARWCEEVRRRFTGQWPSSWCEMMLLGWKNGRPGDPRKALHLLETFGPADAKPLHAMMRPRMQMLAAGVLARAGEVQRADSLLLDAGTTSHADPELLALEASVRILMKNEKRAVELLRDYLARNPGARPRIINNRMYRDVVAQLD